MNWLKVVLLVSCMKFYFLLLFLFIISCWVFFFCWLFSLKCWLHIVNRLTSLHISWPATAVCLLQHILQDFSFSSRLSCWFHLIIFCCCRLFILRGSEVIRKIGKQPFNRRAWFERKKKAKEKDKRCWQGNWMKGREKKKSATNRVWNSKLQLPFPLLLLTLFRAYNVRSNDREKGTTQEAIVVVVVVIELVMCICVWSKQVFKLENISLLNKEWKKK